MRWLFALLLLLNVGLWMWGAWYKTPTAEYAKMPRPAINAEKMRLLSEPGTALHPRTAAESANEPLAPVESAVSKQPPCYAIGPFLTRDAAVKASDKLQELKASYAYRSENKMTPSGYRLIVPAAMTRKAAEQKLKELDGLGIKDYSLIPAPEKQYTISLGTFSRPANARNYQQELTKKGVKAQVETLYPAPQYWLDLKAGQLPAKLLDNLKQAPWGAPEARLRETACLAKNGAVPDPKKNKNP